MGCVRKVTGCAAVGIEFTDTLLPLLFEKVARRVETVPSAQIYSQTFLSVCCVNVLGIYPNYI